MYVLVHFVNKYYKIIFAVIFNCIYFIPQTIPSRPVITSSTGKFARFAEMVTKFSICNTGIKLYEEYSSILCVSIITAVY
jgi:hypothetical protein